MNPLSRPFVPTRLTSYPSDIILGEKYRDDQTGLVGIATGVYFYQHSCERVSLERLVEGKLTNDVFDAPRLTHVTSEQVARVDRTGGPGEAPTRGDPAPR